MNRNDTNPLRWSSRRVVLATLLVAAMAGGAWLVYLCSNVLLLLFVAILLATALMAPIHWLERLGASRPVATTVAHLLVITVVVAVALSIWPLVEQQGAALVESFPMQYEQLHSSMTGSDVRLLRRLAGWLPADAGILFRDGQLAAELGSGWEILAATFWGLFLTFATVLLSIYWSIERQRALRAVLWLLPSSRREIARDFFFEAEGKLGAFVRGQALLCLLVGLLSFVAYWWIGVPYAALLALLAGLLEAVPVIGPIVATIPAAIFALTLGPAAVVWVIVASMVIASIESYLLVPRIMNRSVGLHPVITLLAVTALFALLGPIGGVLAVPLAAIAQLIFKRFVLSSPPIVEDRQSDRRDQQGVLAYRASALFQDLHAVMCHPYQGSNRALFENAEEDMESILHDFSEVLGSLEDEEVAA